MSTMRLSNGPALAQRDVTVAPPRRWRNGLLAIGEALSNYGHRRAAAHLDRLATFYELGNGSLGAQLRQGAADCRAQANAGRAHPINANNEELNK